MLFVCSLFSLLKTPSFQMSVHQWAQMQRSNKRSNPNGNNTSVRCAVTELMMWLLEEIRPEGFVVLPFLSSHPTLFFCVNCCSSHQSAPHMSVWWFELSSNCNNTSYSAVIHKNTPIKRSKSNIPDTVFQRDCRTIFPLCIPIFLCNILTPTLVTYKLG